MQNVLKKIHVTCMPTHGSPITAYSFKLNHTRKGIKIGS